MNKKIIQEISTLVEDACKKDTNAYGYGIWSNHIIHVVKYAKALAIKLNADPEVVELAALLHDYAGIKDSALAEEHHIHGAKEAERLLSSYHYPVEKIEMIKECILSHRGSVQSQRLTPEAQCVASADAMAHISQIPSLLYLTYAKKGMSISEGTQWVKAKLERGWNKLCPEAQEMMRDYYMSGQLILS